MNRLVLIGSAAVAVGWALHLWSRWKQADDGVAPDGPGWTPVIVPDELEDAS